MGVQRDWIDLRYQWLTSIILTEQFFSVILFQITESTVVNLRICNGRRA
jgi:hypothetical protein